MADVRTTRTPAPGVARVWLAMGLVAIYEQASRARKPHAVHATDATLTLRGHLHSRVSRVLAAALVAISRTSLLAIALAGALGEPDILTPSVLAGTLLVFAALPAAAAWLVERTAAARVTLRDDTLVLERPDLEVSLARDRLEQAIPWTIPLPGPGLSFAMCGGGTIGHGLETPDPAPLLAALGAPDAGRHPVVAWAHARAAMPRWRWRDLLWKFAGFSLAPTAVLFNAHQHIAYGGTLGQYYLEGPGAYAETFALYWLTVSIYLLLWASVWRALGEGVALAAAAAAPSHAARVRRAVELVCRTAFYAGVPALVALRFVV